MYVLYAVSESTMLCIHGCVLRQNYAADFNPVCHYFVSCICLKTEIMNSLRDCMHCKPGALGRL